jgi:lambda repressor-like predicted transcriptional regulator
MDSNEIKHALAKKGCSISILARALDLSVSAVSNTINRKGNSHRIAVAVAKVIGKPIEQVFPDIPTYSESYVPDTKKQENYWRERLSA